MIQSSLLSKKDKELFLFLLSFVTNDMEEIKLIRSEITDYIFTMQLPSSSEYVQDAGEEVKEHLILCK